MIFGMGQDSHKFLPKKGEKKCIIAGVAFDTVPGFDADSDGDIVYHAICNAITSITHLSIMGDVAIKMCHEDGVTDSSMYLLEAKKSLNTKKITHIAITIEAKEPRLQKHIEKMRENIAKLLELEISQIGITVTSGNGLDDCGKGLGAKCSSLISLVNI